MKRLSICICILACLAGCSRQVTSDRVVILRTPAPPSESTEKWYQQVKSRWTVILRTQKMGNRPHLMNPLGGGGPGPGMDQSFPLMVQATMMDEEVVEAGLRYYADAATISPEEFGTFAQHYRDMHELDKYLLIEASLQTSLAESYLDLTRYTIFLEDDQMNQYLPARMNEMPMGRGPTSEFIDEPMGDRQPLFMSFASHRKEVFLYFPRNDFYGNPMIHERLQYLKLVFLLEVDGSARAEGRWVFNPE